jgi:hypothetical protein
MEAARPVEVDLLFPSVRMRGIISSDPSRRVSDILNMPDATFVLKDVTVSRPKGTTLASYANLTIEKEQILAAVPLETAQLISSHRTMMLGLARPNLMSLTVDMVLPPYYGHGVIWMPPPASQFALSRLSPFFAFTAAELHFEGKVVVQAGALLVNKARVAGLGPLEEAAHTVNELPARAPLVEEQPVGAAPADSRLDDLWRRLNNL